MGFDKLISFFNKNFSNISEELFDIPNKIIMIILGVSYTDINIINEKLKKIFDKFHWSKMNVCMNDILDGDNIDEILIKFKQFLDDNVNELLAWYLYNNLNHQIISTHPIQFIKSINLFFDGIPTYAKIIEQRRRRVKNYLESKNRKNLFNQYFKNIVNSIIVEDDIMFDYFDWINNFYTFDKSLGPFSPILINLSEFINIKMNENYKNIKIYISNSINNGESDYKIFKHIIDENVDCLIAVHSCDSDFIFLILWYQLISTTKYIDTHLMFINYNNNKTVYFGKKIMNSILDKYATINNINEDVSINVIFDFLALLLLFGNDIIPISYELGPELSLKQIFETHYSLYSNSQSIINLNNMNIINFTNLAKWLYNIKSSNSLSVIILNRFYKMNYNNILLLVEKHKTLNEISKNINDDLIIQNKSFYIENNTYQTLYNYIMFEAENMIDYEFNRNYKMFYNDLKDANNEYIKITKNVNIKNYLTQYISLNQIFFLNFNLYTPFNTIFCDDNIAPSIDMIIQFINLNDMNNLQKTTNDTLKKFNNEIYFNSISHHLFITPYILDSSHFNNLNLKYIESLMNVISNKINGIWLDYNNVDIFNLKKIDTYIFINLCNELIRFYQDNFIDRFFIDNNKLIKYN